MSIQAMSDVMAYSEHRGSVYLVELMIADSVNDQHGNKFWMSQGNLANKCRLSRSTVAAALLVLEECGRIERLGWGPSGVVKYRFKGVRYSDRCPGIGQTLSGDQTIGVRGLDTNPSNPIEPNKRPSKKDAHKKIKEARKVLND
jgi:hypothetical protein